MLIASQSDVERVPHFIGGQPQFSEAAPAGEVCNPATGAVLAAPFDHFQFAGNTWSLGSQLAWIEAELAAMIGADFSVAEDHLRAAQALIPA